MTTYLSMGTKEKLKLVILASLLSFVNPTLLVVLVSMSICLNSCQFILSKFSFANTIKYLAVLVFSFCFFIKHEVEINTSRV